MTVLDVVTYPNPVLRQPAVDVSTFDEKLNQLTNDMIDTMRHYQGVGLAAPQIGILSKLFVIEFEDTLITFINPSINNVKGSEKDYEGCLSIPDLRVHVDRSTSIEVSYQDVNGNATTQKFDGFLARVIQHELDHLNGVLIIDKGQPEYD